MKDKIELRNNFLDNLKNPLSKMEGTFNYCRRSLQRVRVLGKTNFYRYGNRR